MTFLEWLFGKPEPRPDPKVELSGKMAKAAAALMEVISEAKESGFKVEMSIAAGALNLSMTEEIFKTKITGNITDKTRNHERTKVQGMEPHGRRNA